jgi:hypothetical protein
VSIIQSTINRNVPPTFNILSSFQADEVKLNGPNQPIMYRQGKLWAFYGLNQLPKYKSISPFEHNYAKVELPTGKKGWINSRGEEFW